LLPDELRLLAFNPLLVCLGRLVSNLQDLFRLWRRGCDQALEAVGFVTVCLVVEQSRLGIIAPPHDWRGKVVNHRGVRAALYAARLGDRYPVHLERDTPMIASIADIKNFIRIDDDIGTAGQPTAQQFQAVRDAGYEAVVNLLPSEQDNALKDEDALIRELGMEYHYIPVL
jgi:hypothetical protein